MASTLPKPPPGFVIEQSAVPQGNAPEPPPGFVIEQPRGPSPAYVDALAAGSAASRKLQGGPGPATDPAAGEWVTPGGGGIPIVSDLFRSLYPMERNTVSGDFRPAVPKIISGALESLGDAFMAPADALAGKMSDLEIDPETGAVAPFNTQMIERAANAAGWATGGAPGATRTTVLTAAGRKVPKPIVRAIGADGVPVNQVAARVNAFGPEGTVADLGPNLQAQAGALAALPDPAADAVIDRMRTRKAGANTRIRAGLDETLGEAPVPSELQAGIRDARRTVGPQYDHVLADAAPVDTTDLATGLTEQAAAMRGPAQAAIRDVRAMLNGAEGELESSAAVLFQVRQAIDGMIEVQADANVRRVLNAAREDVNALLVEAAPGIQTVDSAYRELARQSGAVDRGQTVLDSGRNAPRPSELADEALHGVQPEGVLIGPSGETFRLSQGARAEIERIVGTNANDRAALERIVKGDGDWNRDRLITLFGEDRANRVFEILRNEGRMAETENAVLRAGGRRADAAAQAEVAPAPNAPGAVQETLNLRAGAAGAKVIDDLVGGHRQGQQSRMNDAVLEELMGRGEGWRGVDRRPMSEMPVPIESWLAELFGRGEEAQPRQSRADPAVMELLLRL